ncbi:peptide chain release factor H [Mucilaginibacter sp. PPCGB 2223]|uniref:peptide chain release factor H n=1 Tax=Mucilaginibacter sp. PPCGB 2223 TaxID=1886027 RepID=UPI00082481BD|nr:peptide chain release factor H [Mucilaginibacter sp. PPCGB 2223]OCX52010.1 peptide chain release factor H [Mucilaginibacter sp. PPCGB 2223]
MMKKMTIQITSGKGPVECCRVVACVQSLMIKQAQQQDIQIEVLENKAGELNGTLLSATMIIVGDSLDAFVKEWVGTVQWIAQSPYRKYHKRKNWFVGVAAFDVKEQTQWNPKDVKLETCRSSGPGGQNVNKVETAVRGTHLPSGLQVMAMDTRSQLENKKLCLARLEAKIMVWQTEQLVAQQQSQWQEHNALERGNPVKTIRAVI